jgi:hypothetical protein
MTGEVAWFCNECGHKVETPPSEAKVHPWSEDDLNELFDRH